MALMLAFAQPGFGNTCPVPANAAAMMNAAAPLLEAARREAGQRAIRRNTQLDAAAQAQACNVARHGYSAQRPHHGPDGSTPKVRVKRAGYRSCLTAENLALNYTSAADLVQAWMASPGHRNNITLKTLRDYGLGLAMTDGQPVWIMVLAKPC